MVAAARGAPAKRGEAKAKCPKAIRRMQFLQKSGLIETGFKTDNVKRARTVDQLREAYRMVHDTYVEQGYIMPTETGIRMRVFEALPGMATFIATADEQIIGSMSIIADRKDIGLPSDKVYGPEINTQRALGNWGAEVTNLAIDHEYRKTGVLFSLIRACFAQGVHWGCDYLFIAISPEHVAFFKDVMQFDFCGESRNYSDETIDIVQGMRMDLKTIEHKMLKADTKLEDQAFLHNWLFARNPFYNLFDRWEHETKKAFADPEFVCRLVEGCGEFRAECVVNDERALCAAWGKDAFRRVFGASKLGELVAQSSELDWVAAG